MENILFAVYNFLEIRKLKKQTKLVRKTAELFRTHPDREIMKIYWGSRSVIERAAAVFEAVRRSLNINLYDEQIMAALGLFGGSAVEMKTGEGKTLAVALAAALLKDTVHIATVNDYLAERDFKNMKPIFDFLNISCGVNLKDEDKKELYKKQIVYSSSVNLIFDYLRNELNPLFEFPLKNAVLDEIDYILLDNANTKFSVSAGKYHEINTEYFETAEKLLDYLRGQEIKKKDFALKKEPENADYVYSTYLNTLYITERGFEKLERLFNTENFIETHFELYKALLAVLQAHSLYQKGRDYIIEDNKIVLINRQSGRKMPDTKLDAYFHTALEVKEKVPVTLKHLFTYSLSYQVFFKKYQKMTGTSGTLYDARLELEGIYNLPVVVIPEHFPVKRIEYDDLFFENKNKKYMFLLDYLKNVKPPKQPALIITNNDGESEKVWWILNKNGISCTLLNSFTAGYEEKIIKEAGHAGTIMVSTNMVSRGTDIIVDKEAEKHGGLLLISLARFPDKRIDNQVKGRTARQGVPGKSLFLISFDDEIFEFLNSKQYKRFLKLKKVNLENYQYRNKALSKLIDEVQENISLLTYKIRENIVQYDVILENQKQAMKKWKNEIKSKDIYTAAEIINTDELLLDKIKKQEERFGRELSKKLFNSILEMVFEEHFLQYLYDMEDIKLYLPYWRLSEKGTVSEFIKICGKQFEEFKKNVIYLSLQYFISAQPSKIVFKYA
ncbi:preprotein translocase subunit SecA [Thermoanaerobacter thermohydrosulfuricus]|uniref:Protein translocase subunit SecA n=1 Tax=Thermoanaerobacter thermohydrosulfuricus TaxID=1516 RepID=A0A1G7SY32_THETY|nr:hypothetical protein [Thermoanaerobacter thermohydrosulfuricus]SDG27674.1 preprotein translocase subunit SecA [Thermoanaerobacter thermohydrosulfuricus]